MVGPYIEKVEFTSDHRPALTTDEEKRRALVERLFSSLSPEELGGLSIDQLIEYGDRMHRTLLGLDPVRQRLPEVFSAIEAELGDTMRVLNQSLQRLGNDSVFGMLVRLARDEFNMPQATYTTEDDED